MVVRVRRGSYHWALHQVLGDKPSGTRSQGSARRAVDTAVCLEGAGREEFTYHLGIFRQAVRRILDWNPASPLTRRELTRLAHALISAAVIAEKIGNNP